MYRQIHTSLWSEPWFEPLSAEAKLLFLYFVTHPLTSAAGFAAITPERMKFETCLEAPAIESALGELSSKILACPEGVWVKRFHRWQGGGPMWAKAVSKAVESLPPIVRDAYLSLYPMDTLLIPHPDPTHTVPSQQNQNQKQNQKQKQQTERKAAATPPTPPDPRLAAATAAYENTIGVITETVGNLLKDMTGVEYKDAPVEWFTEAFQEAAKANVRKLSYVKSCLRNWTDNGRNNGQHGQTSQGHQRLLHKSPRPRDIPSDDEYRAEMLALQRPAENRP